MAAIRTKGGEVLNKYILTKVFAFDDSASDARTPCIAKGWEAVRRGAPMLICPDNVSWTTSDIAISPDNARIAVGNNSTTLNPGSLKVFEVVLHDARTGERRRHIAPLTYGYHVRCVSFSPDGTFIAVGTSIGLILYSANTTGEPRLIMHGDIWFAQIGSNGTVMASRCYETFKYGNFTLFEPSTGAGGTTYAPYQGRWVSRSFSSYMRPPATARFSPDSTMVAVARGGRRLRLCDARDRHVADSRRIQTFSSTVAFSPDGKTLASGHRNVVCLFDCSTCVLQRRYVLHAHDKVTAVAFSPAGRLVFTKGTLEEIPQGTLEQFPEIAIYKRAVLCPELCYTTNDGQLVQRDLDLFGLGNGIPKTEFSSDGSLLAVVGSNSSVALYDVPTATRRLAPRP